MQTTTASTAHDSLPQDDPRHAAPVQPAGNTSAEEGAHGVSPSRSTTSPVKGTPVSTAEYRNLIQRHEDSNAYPDSDSDNARHLADLTRNSLRGEPKEHVEFESAQLPLMQKISVLPQLQRERFSGMQAQVVNAYEVADAARQRQPIAQAFGTLQQQVNDAYAQAMQDPRQRVQNTFTAPFGSDGAGDLGAWQAARLRQLGEQFGQAATPRQRESIFASASQLRHDMQQTISDRIGQQKQMLEHDWQASYDRVTAAMQRAQSLQVAHLGELDNTTSFAKLQQFGQQAFQSSRDVLAFRDLLQQHPDQFQDLKTWYDDAAKKSAWAHDRMLDDPFQRTPQLPAAPQDFTRMPLDDLHAGNFDAEAFARYTGATLGIIDNQQMYHAASQHGPIKQGYLTRHTPPKPLWQQQIEDGIGRFVVGMIPGVNLFVNQIVPAHSLSPAWRQGVDLMSGIIGSVMGTAGAVAGGRAIPVPGEVTDPMGMGGSEVVGGLASRLGKLRKAQKELASTPALAHEIDGHTPAFSEPKTPGETNGASGGTAAGLPGGAEGGQAAAASTRLAQIRDVHPVTPAGALQADPDHPGIWRDAKGASYIQQDGKTYQAGYDDLNDTWWVRAKQSQPVRLDASGHWETHGELTLPGGGNAKYTEQKGFDAYFTRLLGKSVRQTAERLEANANSIGKWQQQYARTHGLPAPRTGAYKGEDGQQFYHRLEVGQPVERIADELAPGNIFRVYYSAMRWADAHHFDTGPVTRSIASFFETLGVDVPGGNVASHVLPVPRRTASQGRIEPATSGASAATSSGADTRIPVPPAVPAAREPGPHPLPIRPVPVRPLPLYRSAPVPGTSTSRSHRASPYPSTARADPNPWRHVFRAFISGGDHGLPNSTVGQIVDWIDHPDRPTPLALAQEIQRVSNGVWTADDLRDYLHAQRGGHLRTDQMRQIAIWLGI